MRINVNVSAIVSNNALQRAETRLSKSIEEGMFHAVKKNTVPMIQNFSEDDEWPEVLPALMPRLLVNGSQGIGVAVAQVWCPYNLREVVDVIDCETHDIFLGRVIDAKKENDNIPMTYKYYHEVIKGTAPKNAPTYSGD